MTPNFGQSACQGMEDVGVLAVCVTGASDVSDALRSYFEVPAGDRV
jgi:2-polyprenyl-6-methoxyphenol hydroxylase-like FAD-dependent oxidoreductase